MKYISIDIETTGIDPETCQILSFGAILEDTSDPQTYADSFKFYYEFHYDRISGSPMALAMNASLIKTMANRKIPKEGIIAASYGYRRVDGVDRAILTRYEGETTDFAQLFLEWVPSPY